MKSVRVLFTQKGRMRFVSHLDMNRFFTRILRLSGLPVWYTEGFNQHVYLTFALPLSLGFESEYSVMDFRVTDDSISFDTIADALRKTVPDTITVLSCAEPVMKPGAIAKVGYRVDFEEQRDADRFYAFLQQKDLVVVKKTKRGSETQIAVADKLSRLTVNGTSVTLVLPAGNDTLNPSLLTDLFCFEVGPTDYRITRVAIYDTNDQLFR